MKFRAMVARLRDAARWENERAERHAARNVILERLLAVTHDPDSAPFWIVLSENHEHTFRGGYNFARMPLEAALEVAARLEAKHGGAFHVLPVVASFGSEKVEIRRAPDSVDRRDPREKFFDPDGSAPDDWEFDGDLVGSDSLPDPFYGSD